MKTAKLYLFALTIVALVSIGFKERQAKILIVGDSISLGYTPFVKETLKDRAVVSHNRGNAQHSGYGLENIEEWIQKDEYDIIQINWGLWDLCYRHKDSKVQGNRDKVNGSVTYTLEEYEHNLEEIVKKIQSRTDAQIIFVTTSYVPKKEEGRYTKDTQKYNKVAKRVMLKYGVKVNDIYKESKSIHKDFGQGVNNVHYKKEGSKELSKLISTSLSKELELIKR